METSPSTASPFSDEWCLHHFDHLSADLPGVLPETLAKMRSLCPVAHSDECGGFWVVTDYEDVLRVAQDWETFSSAHGLTVPVAPIAVRNIPVEVDPPLHRVYKRLINAYFTPAAVAPWEDATRTLVTRLIDDFIEDGRCEFMQAFARPLPAQAFFECAIGAPSDQVERVAYMASKSSVPNDPEAAECWKGLSEWIAAFLDARRAKPPRGDVVDALLHAEIEGRPITHDEVVGTVQLLILGGLETTAGAFGMMMLRIANDPGLAAALAGHPDRLPEAIEELLRLDPPFIAITRTATRDVELGDKQIRAGDKVIIYWASANRDDAEFADPDVFSLERSSNRHLAFGAGPHRCAGSNLARMNLRVGLTELLGRLHDVKLETPDVHYHSTFTRSPHTLPITFTAGPRVGDG